MSAESNRSHDFHILEDSIYLEGGGMKGGIVHIFLKMYCSKKIRHSHFKKTGCYYHNFVTVKLTSGMRQRLKLNPMKARSCSRELLLLLELLDNEENTLSSCSK